MGAPEGYYLQYGEKEVIILPGGILLGRQLNKIYDRKSKSEHPIHAREK